jgi:hypothetical protein
MRSEYENSEYKIFVFDWWNWLYSNPLFHAGNTTGVWNMSTDEIIAEIKEYDICFFVIEEMINAGASPDIQKILQSMMAELDNLNVVYITLSEDVNFPTAESKTFSIPWFIAGEIYTSKNTTIDFDYRSKDFTFNMLLGSDKHERTRAWKVLNNPDKKYNIYSTYIGHKDFSLKSMRQLEDGDILDNFSNQYKLAGYTTIGIRKLNTMERITRDNKGYKISHTIPESIYNNSHFDIVFETCAVEDNSINKSHIHFTTEKTGKPLSTGRFFIWYNCPHVVEYLRKFGFELQDYLCEYDSIIDDDKRLEAVLELIKEIGDNKNYIKKIYEDTKEARMHNQEVYKELMKTTPSKLSSWIDRQIKEK